MHGTVQTVNTTYSAALRTTTHYKLGAENHRLQLNIYCSYINITYSVLMSVPHVTADGRKGFILGGYCGRCKSCVLNSDISYEVSVIRFDRI